MMQNSYRIIETQTIISTAIAHGLTEKEAIENFKRHRDEIKKGNGLKTLEIETRIEIFPPQERVRDILYRKRNEEE